MTPATAVILARGLGTRMRRAAPGTALTAEQDAAAGQGLKAMIPVGRPFLDYLLSSLADAGVTDVCLVVGPDHEPIRRRYRDEVVPTRLSLAWAVQAEPRGTADAVLAAEPVVGAGAFLVVNADNLYPVAALRALTGAASPALIGYRREPLVRESNIDPGRIARFALVWADAAGFLTRIVEKPDPALAADPAALVSMNSWRFGPAIFPACRAVTPSPRGELELQDAVRIAVAAGERFQVIPFSGGVLDLSSRDDVPAVTRTLAGREVRL